MKRSIFMIAAMTMLWPSFAKAEQQLTWIWPLRGNDLLTYCTDGKDAATVGVCGGFITGFVSGVSTVLITHQEQIGCVWDIPGDVTLAQMVDVVVKGLKDHPERRNELAVQLVVEYVKAAFPCK
ncbi:MAG: hypothetical protein E6Q98_15920 [Rhodospirillaceae bacterium]|nr:MAG: hypothetical protein E6Q98_15920 [Rhodospirillaceae bacterium]